MTINPETQTVEQIQVKLTREPFWCRREQYVAYKHRSLVEFGFRDLSVAEVDEQLALVLAGKTLLTGLNTIGAFIEGDIVRPQPKV